MQIANNHPKKLGLHFSKWTTCDYSLFNPFTHKISMYKFSFLLLCISSTTNSESWDYIKLYHCLCPSAWNCADIAQRNYSLVASGSERVKKRWKIQCCDLHSQSDTKIFQWVREWNLGAEPSVVFLHSCSNHHIGIIIPVRSTTIQNSSSSRRWSLYLQHRGWILGQHHCR